MSKMGSHVSFGNLKHKLWLREGSGPLKVRNWPDFLVCRWHATCRWKDLDKGYNFASDFISIGGLQRKLWPPKLRESQIWEFRDSHLGVPGQNAIWMWASWRGTKYIIRGKVVASPKFESWSVLWVWVCPWFVLAPKVFKLCTNQLVVWFVQICVSNWCLSLFLVPISELQHAPLPSKCYKPGNVPQLLTLPLFPLQTHIWIYKGGWERVKLHVLYVIKKCRMQLFFSCMQTHVVAEDKSPKNIILLMILEKKLC
jgi:hypothetical protein